MDLVSVNGTKVIDEVISKANVFLSKKEQALQVSAGLIFLELSLSPVSYVWYLICFTALV